jgi:hypothetical protein
MDNEYVVSRLNEVQEEISREIRYQEHCPEWQLDASIAYLEYLQYEERHLLDEYANAAPPSGGSATTTGEGE